jgi:hypothetical protein
MSAAVLTDPREWSIITLSENDPPAAETICPRCKHGRTQHSREGCIWSEQRGSGWWECPCPVRYMDL